MNVTLNEQLLKEVEYFNYSESHVAIDGIINAEVKLRTNEVGKVDGGMKTCSSVDHWE